MARRGPKELTDDHKAAMATGRAESRTVKAYLEAIRQSRPRRGRRRTPDSIRERLTEIEEQLTDPDALSELKLFQERRDLQRELEAIERETEIADLERAFVGVAANYGERNGITYDTWREFGIDAKTLEQAGIGRS